MTSRPNARIDRANGHDDPDQWNESEFADRWVAKDANRRDDRALAMKDALALMPFDRAQALSAVDIGAGYGLFASEILTAFPFVTVTLQDVSEPMHDMARTRLAGHADRIRFVRSDLSSPSWTASLGGQFDLAVSSIAIHNLYDLGRIAQVYSEIHEVLKPGGAFINLDHISRVGGAEGQTDWLRQAGFVEVECVEITERLARLSGKKAL